MIKSSYINTGHPERATEDATQGLRDSAILPPASTQPRADSPETMDVMALVDHCGHEINNYRRGAPCNDEYCLELFRRATAQRDALAWEALQRCLHEIVLCWVRRHPQRAVACRFDSEGNYVARAFARFWQATVCYQQVEFSTLAAALHYLRASVNGEILDTLRTYSRSQEISLLDAEAAGEAGAEQQFEEGELWEVIRNLLPDERERRVAYLLYHCGLKPREIVHYCSQEFSEVQEIYRLRHHIIERLMRNVDRIRWRLDVER